MFKRKTKKVLRTLILLVLLCLIIWLIKQELAPFDYNVQNWWKFYFRSSLAIGPDSSERTFYRVKELKNYENELSLLVQEIYRFVDSRPDLSKVSDPNSKTIDFRIVDNGLRFF